MIQTAEPSVSNVFHYMRGLVPGSHEHSGSDLPSRADAKTVDLIFSGYQATKPPDRFVGQDPQNASLENPYQAPQAEPSPARLRARRSLLWLLLSFNGRISPPEFWAASLAVPVVFFLVAPLVSAAFPHGRNAAETVALLLVAMYLWTSLWNLASTKNSIVPIVLARHKSSSSQRLLRMKLRP